MRIYADDIFTSRGARIGYALFIMLEPYERGTVSSTICSAVKYSDDFAQYSLPRLPAGGSFW